MSVLCHLGQPRTSKPETQHEYGMMRVQMIQSPWVCLSEEEFIDKVTVQGCPFYGALMHGRDLMELQSEKAVWRAQSLLGLDFDHCPVSSRNMVELFSSQGLAPWAGYHTFSNDPISNGGESYRLIWKVNIDLNLKYEECSAAIKEMRLMSQGHADKFAANPTRLFQGANKGAFLVNGTAPKINLRSLSHA